MSPVNVLVSCWPALLAFAIAKLAIVRHPSMSMNRWLR
jgi:hypothetical protein